MNAIDERPAHVFYRASDCAGFFRRAIAIAVDFTVLFAMIVAYEVALATAGVASLDDDDIPGWYIASIILLVYCYLTLLKRSSLRTPGYWLTGLGIVDLKGRPPSMGVMSLRLLWWGLGPVNPLLDIFFMTNDSCRQTIRDKLMGTYVINRHALPAGIGRKRMGTTSFMGMMLLFPVVSQVASEDGDKEG